jgi:CubicO group peptidase (beta-lactamase class C family)
MSPAGPTRRSFLTAAGATLLPLLLPACRGQHSGVRATELAMDYVPRNRSALLLQRIPRWMERSKVPGVSIVTVDNARVSWSASFGKRHANAPYAVDKQTIFEAASMSKPLFSYAVLKLVENGVLDLDRPLDDYLAEPYAPEEPAISKITARMVLSHTTGLPNWRKRNGGSSDLYLLHPPGRKFGYSGEGFVYLQTAVETLVDMDIGQYLRTGPLNGMGMTYSSYTWRDVYEDNYAHGHDANGKPREYKFRRKANTAASLYTTADEYVKFLLAMMGHGNPGEYQLAPEMLAAMLTPVSRKQDGFHYGLGWGLCRSSTGGTIVYHGGSNRSGHRCLCAFDRKAGSGFVLMANGRGGGILRRQIADVIYPGARLGDTLGS